MLALRLKELRKKAGITQEQLAAAIDVERSSVGKYESPTKPVQPSSEVLLKLASYFGVTTDYLLGNTAKKPTAPEGSELINTVTFSRNGKIVKKQYSPEKWKTIIEMLDAIPEDKLP